jgi:hypothetical protein
MKLSEILSGATNLVNALSLLIQNLRPTKQNPPLVRGHFATDRGGTQFCLYCGRPAPWPEGERCPKFK